MVIVFQSSSKYSFIQATFPLFKTVWKILFQDHHQLSCVLLNIVHELQLQSFREPNLHCRSPRDLGDVLTKQPCRRLLIYMLGHCEWNIYIQYADLLCSVYCIYSNIVQVFIVSFLHKNRGLHYAQVNVFEEVALYMKSGYTLVYMVTKK